MELILSLKTASQILAAAKLVEDDYRKQIHGVHFQTEGDYLTFTATNGHSLVRRKLFSEETKGLFEEGGKLLTPEFLSMLEACYKYAKKMKHNLFTTKITASMVSEYQFPNVAGIIPREDALNVKFKFNPKIMIEALNALDNSKPVILSGINESDKAPMKLTSVDPNSTDHAFALVMPLKW